MFCAGEQFHYAKQQYIRICFLREVDVVKKIQETVLFKICLLYPLAYSSSGNSTRSGPAVGNLSIDSGCLDTLLLLLLLDLAGSIRFNLLGIGDNFRFRLPN